MICILNLIEREEGRESKEGSKVCIHIYNNRIYIAIEWKGLMMMRCADV